MWVPHLRSCLHVNFIERSVSSDGRDLWVAMATLYKHADQIFNTTKGNVWGANYLDAHPNGLYECMVRDAMALESLQGDLSALISRRKQEKMALYITAERLEAMRMPVLNHRRQQKIAAGDFEIDYDRGLRFGFHGRVCCGRRFLRCSARVIRPFKVVQCTRIFSEMLGAALALLELVTILGSPSAPVILLISDSGWTRSKKYRSTLAVAPMLLFICICDKYGLNVNAESKWIKGEENAVADQLSRDVRHSWCVVGEFGKNGPWLGQPGGVAARALQLCDPAAPLDSATAIVTRIGDIRSFLDGLPTFW